MLTRLKEFDILTNELKKTKSEPTQKVKNSKKPPSAEPTQIKANDLQNISAEKQQITTLKVNSNEPESSSHAVNDNNEKTTTMKMNCGQLLRRNQEIVSQNTN